MEQAPQGEFEHDDAWLAPGGRDSQRMRLGTLTRLRWLSVAGQTAACVFVAWGLWFPFPVWLCLGLIALSVALNVFLTRRFSRTHRLSAPHAAIILTFDIIQPSLLMYLTGGIQNPFAVFLIVPAMIAAATQPAQTTVGLVILAISSATALTFFHLPLPWPAGTELALPMIYLGGVWFALITTLLFAAFYISRVAAEARTLAEALGATELVLQREQHLSALDGLAAAAAHELGTPLATIALVAKEMGRIVPTGNAMREDVDLLIAQSQRCRDILRQLASLSSSSEVHMARLSLPMMIEDVIAPHRDFGIRIVVKEGVRNGPEPVGRRNAGLLYGLGNIVENAVDFARSEVVVEVSWTPEAIQVIVTDDGSGFPAEVLKHIGEPYMSDRQGSRRTSGGGLGLGLFIAKTLIERSGARTIFANKDRRDGEGAIVTITWPYAAFPQERRGHGETVNMPELVGPV